eukprot:340695_1
MRSSWCGLRTTAPKSMLVYHLPTKNCGVPVLSSKPPLFLQQLHMSLVPLNAKDFRRIIPLNPSAPQMVNWLGQTPLQQQARVAQEIGVGLLLIILGFFLGRHRVKLVTPLRTMVLVCARWALGPYITAKRTNESFFGNDKRSALYTSRVVSAKQILVSEPMIKHRFHFHLVLRDESRKELEIEVPFIPRYLRVAKGMIAECIVACNEEDQDFSRITSISEVVIPSVGIEVGNYPFLNRMAFNKFLARQHARRRIRRTVRQDDGSNVRRKRKL